MTSKKTTTPGKTTTSSKKPISEHKFQSLVKKLKSLQIKGETASLDSKLETYWSYGDLIEAQDLLDDVGYHNSVLRDLAVQTGIALRTLQHSVAFRRTYPKAPVNGDLSWSHIRVLIQLPTKKQRDFYARLVREQNWSSRELQQAIAADHYAGGELMEPQLERPTEAAYLYRAKEVRVIDGDTLEVLVDLGFDSFTLQRIRLAQINTSEPHTAAGRAARNFLAAQLAEAKTVVIKTHATDVHGRYVAHLFTSPRKVTIDTCFKEGLFQNDLLVQHKHARVVG